MRTAIFDLDGTLADTGADLIAAANAAFARRGEAAPLDPHADKATAFRGGRAMLELGYRRLAVPDGPARYEEDYRALLAHYAEHIDRETELYPGVIPTLEALATAGWRLGICTNKPIDLAETLVARLGLDRHFGALIGAGSLEVRKPDARPVLETITRAGGQHPHAVMIGDTATDRAAAEAATIPCILVTFGPEGEAVAQLSPEGLLADYAALPDLLDTVLPPP
ncbi:MAG: HAD-IA family hydrolase [Pseudomonadota bacterium]